MASRDSCERERVLYDGWPLAYQPQSPAALQLLTILELHPAGIEPVVALPAPSFHLLPQAVATLYQPAGEGPASRLGWEQRTLSGLASSNGARLVHLTGGAPSLFGKTACAVSPTAYSETDLFDVERGAATGWAERLRVAAAWGSLARQPVLLWPSDLPRPNLDARFQVLPAIVHPAFLLPGVDNRPAQENFRQLTGMDLPETYILYHGPDAEADLRRLLSAWSWAAASIGNQYPMLLVGVRGRQVENLLGQLGLEDNIHLLPELPVSALAALYQGCSLLFHPAPLPAWGDPVRMAQACGKPVVALESQRSAALVGPAAYLAPFDVGGRALGAALLSVVVDESLSASLSARALDQAAHLNAQAFQMALAEFYRQLL